MITLADFQRIDHEVMAGVTQTLNYIKDRCRDHNYVSLLAECEYKKDLVNSAMNLNPYVVDDFMGKRQDNTRIFFLVDFLRTYYSFPNNTNAVHDDDYRMNLELMIYSHTWEAEAFLKKLYRLGKLAVSDAYDWEIVVPEMGKHDFIRYSIRDLFKSVPLAMADIISKGFHTSLRNAFAHSQYSFNKNTRKIELYNYKGAAWELKSISFDDWSTRFAYTFFLNYHLLNELHLRRMDIANEFGTNSFLMVHPISENRFRVNRIYYDVVRDTFSFYQ